MPSRILELLKKSTALSMREKQKWIEILKHLSAHDISLMESIFVNEFQTQEKILSAAQERLIHGAQAYQQKLRYLKTRVLPKLRRALEKTDHQGEEAFAEALLKQVEL